MGETRTRGTFNTILTLPLLFCFFSRNNTNEQQKENKMGRWPFLHRNNKQAAVVIIAQVLGNRTQQPQKRQEVFWKKNCPHCLTFALFTRSPPSSLNFFLVPLVSFPPTAVSRKEDVNALERGGWEAGRARKETEKIL